MQFVEETVIEIPRIQLVEDLEAQLGVGVGDDVTGPVSGTEECV